MPRTSKSVRTAFRPLSVILLVSVVSVVSVMAFALPNLASATTAPYENSASFLRTICDGNCGDFESLDSRRMDAGFAGDFSLGLSLIRNGLDLTLKSDGNILIVGALSAAGTVDIRSDARIDVGGNTVVDANDLILGTGFFVDDLFFRPTNDATVSIASAPECDCSVLTGAGRDIRLRAGNLRVGSPGRIELITTANAGATGTANAGSNISIDGATIVAAVTGVDAIFQKTESSSEVFVYREGDIYIDVSGFEFENFKVIAGKSIVFVGSNSAPVPEPGTAVLFGLGLTMLAARRRSIRFHTPRGYSLQRSGIRSASSF